MKPGTSNCSYPLFKLYEGHVTLKQWHLLTLNTKGKRSFAWKASNGQRSACHVCLACSELQQRRVAMDGGWQVDRLLDWWVDTEIKHQQETTRKQTNFDYTFCGQFVYETGFRVSLKLVFPILTIKVEVLAQKADAGVATIVSWA